VLTDIYLIEQENICCKTIITHKLLLPVAAHNQPPATEKLIEINGYLLKSTTVCLPLLVAVPSGRFSLPVLPHILHPFTGPVPVPHLTLSSYRLTFGVGDC